MNEYKEKIKSYHIFLFSCLLASLMILNSNNVNNQKQALKSQKQSEEFFSEMMKIRKLSGGNSNTEEVCSRADDDLIDYYKTGDLSKIDLDNDPIECEDKDKSYMKTLIDIVREMADDDSSSNSGDGSRLRNLGSLDTNKLVDYLMRTLPFLIFLVFGVLSIFGWIICCICCCCDCCCCCCCKKESCKVPCFIFTFVFYALCVAISIYGLSQSKKIFVGLANTECSILKFFGQVLDGEIKQERPRWAGIDIIKNLLDQLVSEIDDIKGTAVGSLNGYINNIEDAKRGFHNQMNAASLNFFEDGTCCTYKEKYYKNYNSISTSDFPIDDDYILDVVKNFGKQQSEIEDGKTIYKYLPIGSTLYKWNEEYSIVSGNADRYMSSATGSFSNILSEDNIGRITGPLNDGKENLDKLTKPFTDAEKEFGTLLAKYSGHIDKYGKMSVTIVFSVLMVINLGLAVLMLLIYLFSTKTCAGCCCMRCLFKFCTHILWNVLSLMIIVSFIVGSILGLFGRVGGDMMSLVTYIMSKDNFVSETPLLLNKLGSAKGYIQRCIHDDGNIAAELNLDSDFMQSFDDINTAELQLNNAISEFDELTRHCVAYEDILQQLIGEANIDGSTQLIASRGLETNKQNIKYNEILEKINGATLKNVQWDVRSSNDGSCDSITQTTFFKPNINCRPYDEAQKVDQNPEYLKFANILKEIDQMVEKANNNAEADSVIKTVESLKEQYDDFLGIYTQQLGLFLGIIQQITGIVRDYSGDNDLFSFLNGKFIGTNLKIILKYLKYSLGVDLYTVGVMLIVVGCSLALSVSSTIILIVIINIELKKNMDARAVPNTGMVPENQPNYPQQVISYENNKI